MAEVSRAVRLDENQTAAINAPAGPVAVIAGPGSGKTSTLVARIARLCADSEINPGQSIALCHTTKAAGELRERLTRTAGAAVTCSTIHAAAWRCVRNNHQAAGLGPAPELAANMYPLLRNAARDVLGAAGAEDVPDIAAEIEWARAHLHPIDEYGVAAAAAKRTSAVDANTIRDVWTRYRDLKVTAGVVDFADTLELAAHIVADTAHGAQLSAAVDAVFVDEYQDVDAAQQRLIDAWLAGSDRLCVVGDPSQAIFHFKGCDVSFLTGFAERYPGATVVELTANYRSTPQVVEWLNRLASPGRAALHAAGGDGAAPRIHHASDEAAEERALVDQIRTWARAGVPYDAMAVLYRFRASAARVEETLTAAGIPHHVAGEARFFERPEVRAVLVPFGQAARAEPDADGVELLASCAAETGWDPDRPPEGAGPARQRWEAITALVGAAAERHAGVAAHTLLTELQTRAKASWDLTPGGVTLATVHAAKGLEWDAVWVIGAVEGQMPSAFANTAADLDEERNICFVALSRARTHLVISAAARRHNGWSSKPSRYLDLLTANSARPSSRRHAGGRRGRSDDRAGASMGAPSQAGGCERCGDRLRSAEARTARRCSGGCLTGATRDRFDALVAWREQVAIDEGIPATRVAGDRALFRAAVRGTTCGVTGLDTTSRAAPPF